VPEGVCQRWLQAVTCRRDMVSELPRTPNLRGNDIELSWKPVYPCAAVAHGVDDRPGDLLLLLLLPLPTEGTPAPPQKFSRRIGASSSSISLSVSLCKSLIRPTVQTEATDGRTQCLALPIFVETIRRERALPRGPLRAAAVD
jgi:hypothetical protein